MFMKKLSYGASAVAILMASASAVHAQETTGGIVGGVYDGAGSPVAGATVTVRHTPSGTSATAVTDASGGFSLRNLRVGGPYIVEVSSAAGSTSAQVAGIGIGAPTSVDMIVGADATELSEVVVTGARSGGLLTGPRSTFNADDLETLPSLGRDIKDTVRTSPFATIDPTNSNALSIGGQNTRYNAFLIDGTRQGDDFGLNNGGYPTLNTPISISVLQAVSVDVAPYSVQYGNFTGGVVNSVTKSGGNEFQGEAFYETTNQGLQGNTYSYEDFETGERWNRDVDGDFEETTWGATLSGPIIRDRLFFLANYEKFESSQPVLTGPEGSGAAQEVDGITQADIDEVRRIMRDVYGYDPQDWRADELTVEDEKYFGKLDWNINDRHRAVASYQRTEGGDLRLSGTSTNSSNPSVGLLSSSYTVVSTLETYKAQLFSDWTDTFSTEFAFSKKSVENVSTPGGEPGFAAFQVFLEDPSTTSVDRSIRLGTERSRQANALTVDTTQYRMVGNWDAGHGHRFSGGFEREELDIFNLFVQVANAEYEFASLEDLENRQASTVNYANARTHNANDAAASFSYAMNTLYFQDEWSVSPELKITAGLRYDWYQSDDNPEVNPAFVERFGFANDATLDGISVLQPRVGFNWRPSPDLTIYGGFGRFQGGSPNVWIANSYQNNGMMQGAFSCKISSGYSSQFGRNFQVCDDPSILADVDGFQPNEAIRDEVTESANLGTGNINLIDPAFETPSIWKTSLGASKFFDLNRWGMGDGWNVTAEYIHSELENAIGWIDLSLAETQNGTAPDGRPLFDPNPVRTGQQVLMLTNFKGGKTDQFAVSLRKDWYEGWAEGLGFNLSYTHLDSEDRSPATSSTASSNFGNIALFDPNNPTLSTSNYEIEDAIKLNVSYSRAFFGDYRTRVNLFAQRRSGLPYSYTFAESSGVWGDVVSTQRQLLYVPQVDSSGMVTASSDPIVTYDPGFDLAEFNAFLNSTGLIKYAGSIAPRNAFKFPDITTVDLSLSQEIPAFFPNGARAEAYLTIKNLGNLLNDEWGTIQQIGFPSYSNGVAASIVGDQYLYEDFNYRSTTNLGNQSVWQMKVGVRYKF